MVLEALLLDRDGHRGRLIAQAHQDRLVTRIFEYANFKITCKIVFKIGDLEIAITQHYVQLNLLKIFIAISLSIVRKAIAVINSWRAEHIQYMIFNLNCNGVEENAKACDTHAHGQNDSLERF
jgi:hypothetical protein